jgi:hypothetical protein
VGGADVHDRHGRGRGPAPRPAALERPSAARVADRRARSRRRRRGCRGVGLHDECSAGRPVEAPAGVGSSSGRRSDTRSSTTVANVPVVEPGVDPGTFRFSDRTKGVGPYRAVTSRPRCPWSRTIDRHTTIRCDTLRTRVFRGTRGIFAGWSGSESGPAECSNLGSERHTAGCHDVAELRADRSGR